MGGGGGGVYNFSLDKGCFLDFQVLRAKAPFSPVKIFSGGFVEFPVQEALEQTPKWRKVLKAPSGKNTL